MPDKTEEEKGMTEDELVGWHHQLNGHEFEQAPRVGDGQGRLACCAPWGCTESDTPEPLSGNHVAPVAVGMLHLQVFHPHFPGLVPRPF